MREQMRNSDRQLSNIEAHPEGFNTLRRMYETIQVWFCHPVLDLMLSVVNKAAYVFGET